MDECLLQIGLMARHKIVTGGLEESGYSYLSFLNCTRTVWPDRNPLPA